jgi:ribosome-binding protein aMBF1 (putative translation factor)
MTAARKVKKKVEEPVTTLVSEIVSEAMEKQKVEIRDLAEKLGVTYETVRGIVRGLVVPSKFVLKPIADALGLDDEELGKAAVADRIRKKYGTVPLVIAGKNPELEPIERVWQHLTNEHKQDLVGMAQMYAKRDRA